jgi:RHS repeat-associated protein
MTHGPLGGTLDNFVYDSRSRIVQAGTTQYLYDAKNQRIGVDGTRFVVNSQPALSQVLVKTNADGSQTFYVYGLGLIGEESAAGYKAYHFDFRGSTVALSDDSGAVLERFSYSAYGILLSGDASQTPFLFNGMYGVMTDGNGLYHMRARFYSAEIRRFLNRDVLLGSVAEGQSLNRFGFVMGKPVKYIDPWGLETALVFITEAAVTEGEPRSAWELPGLYAMQQLREELSSQYDSLEVRRHIAYRVSEIDEILSRYSDIVKIIIIGHSSSTGIYVGSAAEPDTGAFPKYDTH